MPRNLNAPPDGRPGPPAADELLQPFVGNEILQVLVLAILTAAAVSTLPRVQREQIVGVFRIAVGIALVVGIDRIMSEGRALPNATGNSVATMVIAGWAGERDDARFRAVLAEPAIVDRDVERALSGAEGGDGTAAPPRFERDPATGAHVPAGWRREHGGEPKPGDCAGLVNRTRGLAATAWPGREGAGTLRIPP